MLNCQEKKQLIEIKQKENKFQENHYDLSVNQLNQKRQDDILHLKTILLLCKYNCAAIEICIVIEKSFSPITQIVQFHKNASFIKIYEEASKSKQTTSYSEWKRLISMKKKVIIEEEDQNNQIDNVQFEKNSINQAKIKKQKPNQYLNQSDLENFNFFKIQQQLDQIDDLIRNKNMQLISYCFFRIALRPKRALKFCKSMINVANQEKVEKSNYKAFRRKRQLKEIKSIQKSKSHYHEIKNKNKQKEEDLINLNEQQKIYRPTLIDKTTDQAMIQKSIRRISRKPSNEKYLESFSALYYKTKTNVSKHKCEKFIKINQDNKSSSSLVLQKQRELQKLQNRYNLLLTQFNTFNQRLMKVFNQ